MNRYGFEFWEQNGSRGRSEVLADRPSGARMLLWNANPLVAQSWCYAEGITDNCPHDFEPQKSIPVSENGVDVVVYEYRRCRACGVIAERV